MNNTYEAYHSNDKTTIKVSVPLIFEAGHNATESEIHNIITDGLRNNLFTFLQMIKGFGLDLLDDSSRSNTPEIGDCIYLLAQNCIGYVEALEIEEIQYSRKPTESTEPRTGKTDLEKLAAPKPSENSAVKSMALKLDFILNQADITDEAQDVIEAVLCNTANSIGFGLGDNQLIEQSFLLLVDSLSFQFGAYLMETLQTLLESKLFSDEVQEQLRNVRDQNRAEVSQVLNLSEISPESLNVKLSEIHNLKNGELATVISELLHNKNLPTKLHNVLADELTVAQTDAHSPEQIQFNLNILSEKESND